MRTSRSLLAALVTTTACAALLVPTTAALAAQGGPGSQFSAFGFGPRVSAPPSEVPGAAARAGGREAGAEDGDDGAPAGWLARARHVRARLAGSDTAVVTWDYGAGVVPPQVFVRLVPREGTALQRTLDGDARAVTIPGLEPSTRYAVTIASVASDGSSTTPVHAEGPRTRSASAAARVAARIAEHARHVADVAAVRARRIARSADAGEAAAAAGVRADRAAARAHDAEADAERARRLAEDRGTPTDG